MHGFVEGRLLHERVYWPSSKLSLFTGPRNLLNKYSAGIGHEFEVGNVWTVELFDF